jgi:hypothetical protein
MKEMNINLKVSDFCEGYFVSELLPEYLKEVERVKKVIISEESTWVNEEEESSLNEVLEDEFAAMELNVECMCKEHDESYRRNCQIESEIQSEIYTWNESNQLTHIKV